MDQVVLVWKIISYSKIFWLFQLRLKTDFQNRNREVIRRKFSMTAQTLLNNLLLFNFFPSPGTSRMEGIHNCLKCRSNSGEGIMTLRMLFRKCCFPGDPVFIADGHLWRFAAVLHYESPYHVKRALILAGWLHMLYLIPDTGQGSSL